MPVKWPEGWKRTPPGARKRGHFTTTGTSDTGYPVRRDVSFTSALTDVQGEVGRMKGAHTLVIEHAGDSDVHGIPMKGRREPDDPGVVVRWKRGGKSYAIACDTYSDRAQNLRAVAKTIEATRGIERWGAVTGEQAFAGYESLPPRGGFEREVLLDPWVVLGVQENAPRAVVEAAFRALAMKAHPDKGGSADAMRVLTEARDKMLGTVRSA